MLVAHISLFFAVCGFLALCVAAHQRVDRHEGHTHYQPKGDGSKNLLKDKKYVRDYEHVKEDLQEMYNKDFSDNLDDMELENFYFQLHDLNQDKQLDGLELLAAMNHVMNREDEISKEDLEDNPQVRASLQNWWNDKFQEDAVYIDEILSEEDLDEDGYLSYFEYALGRQKEREK